MLKMMKKRGKEILFLFFIFVINPVLATINPNQINMQQDFDDDVYDEAISLGCISQVACAMSGNQLRKAAYPFDWVTTNYESLRAFIFNQGIGFFERDKLNILGVHPIFKEKLCVEDTLYGIISTQDFLGPDMPNYEEVKAKYDRRVKRFFDLLGSNKRILFIRANITRDQTIDLNEILKTLYPNLLYTIIAIGTQEEHKLDWQLEHVKNFYIPTLSSYEPRWKEILSRFYLKSTEN